MMKQLGTRRELSKLFRSKRKNNYQKEYKKIKYPKTVLSEEEHLNKLKEAFQQGRQEYMNLFRECPEALVYTNIDGIVMKVNRYFENLTGFLEEEIKGDSIVYSLKPEDRAYFETDNSSYIETSISSRDGFRIEVSVNKSYNQTKNRLAGIMFSFREISHLRRERKIIQTLYHISQLANMDVSLSEIYSLIHEQLGQIIDATNFYIALMDNEKGELDFPYYTDEAAGDDEIFINRYCTSQSIFHYVLKIGKPVLMDFQRYRKMLSYGYIEPWDVMTNTHLWLAVPLKADEKIIGVIALQSYDNARLYSERDIDLLEFVSQQLSSAIYRKFLEGKLKHLSQEHKDSTDAGNLPITNRLIKVRDEEKRKKESYIENKEKESSSYNSDII